MKSNWLKFFLFLPSNSCLPLKLQYDVKKRISAQDGLRHRFFDSLGPAVHTISDGKLILDLSRMAVVF
jgi:hypothetical protein